MKLIKCSMCSKEATHVFGFGLRKKPYCIKHVVLLQARLRKKRFQPNG
jgi:hypothetical protein